MSCTRCVPRALRSLRSRTNARLARQESGEHIDVILVGTGSEVSLCIDAAKHADLQGKSVRVVSFPSWTLFEEQSQEYKYVVRCACINKQVPLNGANKTGWHAIG